MINKYFLCTGQRVDGKGTVTGYYRIDGKGRHFIYPSNYELYENTDDFIVDGFAILPETVQRVAVKIIVETEPDREFIDYICPNCRDTITQISKEQRDTQIKRCGKIGLYRPKFHDECGQRLDWSEI